VYQNRRRVRGDYGKSLLRRRGELVERGFAHCYDTGGMRRTHLRGHANILKRQLVHVGAFNLSLILRQVLGAGTPRQWKNQSGMLILRLFLLLTCSNWPNGPVAPGNFAVLDVRGANRSIHQRCRSRRNSDTYTTAC
jgi:transposase